MRRLRSLLLALLVASGTVLGAWLLMLWVDAGAPSPTDVARQHPALGSAFGLLSSVGMLALAWRQRRRRKSH